MRILRFRVYATCSKLKLDLELELRHSDAKACDNDFCKPLKGNNSIDDF